LVRDQSHSIASTTSTTGGISRAKMASTTSVARTRRHGTSAIAHASVTRGRDIAASERESSESEGARRERYSRSAPPAATGRRPRAAAVLVCGGPRFSPFRVRNKRTEYYTNGCPAPHPTVSWSACARAPAPLV